MKTILAGLIVVGVLAGATAAHACLPPLPRTSEERASELLARQEQALSQGTLIFEVEVGSVYSISPVPGGPPIAPALRVELRPIRLLRGEGDLQSVEMSYPVSCGVSIGYPVSPGTRLIAWSRNASVDDGADIVDLILVEDILDAQILALLGAPQFRKSPRPSSARAHSAPAVSRS